MRTHRLARLPHSGRADQRPAVISERKSRSHTPGSANHVPVDAVQGARPTCGDGDTASAWHRYAQCRGGAGEILVSRTVRDLIVGSGKGFVDRGSVELRGVPGTWQLLAVDRQRAGAGSAEAELASMPTPGLRTAMRRSDRAVEVIARRTPWILRGMARLTPATGRR